MERNAPDNSRFSPPNVSNVVQVDGVENSPASPAAGPPRHHNRQVAISRNSSTHERPERARTSHACEPCRERKTKCDGDRPSCRRCLHTSTSCHYGYGKGWKKRKTVEDLTATLGKLARYETLLDDIFPLVTDSVRSMIDQARLQESGPLDGSDAAESATASSGSTFDVDVKSGSPLGGRLPLPLPVSLTQSSSSSASTQRTFPPPPMFRSSLSPTRSGLSIPRSDKSPSDDISSNTAPRLPSITRHGFLVGGALCSAPSQMVGTAGFETKRVVEKRSEGVQSKPPRPG